MPERGFSRRCEAYSVVALFGLVLCLASSAAQACACIGSSATIWPPPGSRIPTNVQFIVQGDGEAAEEVAGLAGRKPRLASYRGEVRLSATRLSAHELSGSDPARVERFTRGAEQEVWLLSPAGPLEPDLRYELVLEKPPRGYSEAWLSGEGGASWITSAGPDNAAPVWRGKPVVRKASHFHHMCGTHISVSIAAPAQDAMGPTLFQVELRLLPDGEKRSVWVAPAEQGELLLGGDFCGGENVRLEPLARYQLRLTAVDAAGKQRAAVGPPLEVVIPEAHRRISIGRTRAELRVGKLLRGEPLREDFREVIMKGEERIAKCATDDSPPPDTSLTLSFRLKKGQPTKLKVTAEEPAAAFARCVEQLARGWRFPKPKPGNWLYELQLTLL